MINVQKDACFGLSLTLFMIFKLCSQFSKMAIFEKIVKIPFLKNVNFFNDFQCGTPSCSHALNEFVVNLVHNKIFLKKMRFYVFYQKKKN